MEILVLAFAVGVLAWLTHKLFGLGGHHEA